MNWIKSEINKEKNAFGFKCPSKVLTKATHQTGKTIKSIDKKRNALPPGKRISKTGKIYYEYRKNRSDLTKEGL